MRRWFIPAVGIWLALALAAQAGFFRLELRPGSRVLAGRVSVRATLTNRGDEVMGGIQTKIWFHGAWYKGPQYPELGVGGSLKDDVDVGPLPRQPGTYTAVVTARYTDRNGHPFTTIETIPVHTMEPLDRHPFDATLSSVTLKEAGTLTLDVHARTNTALSATVHLVLPEELQGLPTPDAAFTLAEGTHLTRDFAIRNAWAVPGSRYRIFAIVDYSDGRRHGSRVVPAGVKLAARRALSDADMRRLWILPGALLLLFGLAQFRKPPVRASAA